MTTLALEGRLAAAVGVGAQVAAQVPALCHAPRGRSLESLLMLVAITPPSPVRADQKLLALCVTTPSKQAAWAAAASALRMNAASSLGAARLLTATLARLTTSLFGSPVDSSEAGTIAFPGHIYGEVELVGGDAHEHAAVYDGREVISDNMDDRGPDFGEGPVMVGGAGGADKCGGQQGMAVSADERNERALVKDLEKGPRFGSRRRVAPRGWPSQSIREQVTSPTDDRNAEPRASDGFPPAAKEGAVTVPSGIGAARRVFRQGYVAGAFLLGGPQL